tara:strand:+ start:663 stop:1046 length:384 start_codon:yes stop_codon:yes gene_type:complete
MSHFTHIKTRIQNLSYLESALNRLNINFEKEKKTIVGYQSQTYDVNLVIPQSNGYEIGFNWNGEEYELIVDLSFWNQPWSLETFMEKLSQSYANETILTESAKQGFEQIKQTTNNDGSITLVLERWN